MHVDWLWRTGSESKRTTIPSRTGVWQEGTSFGDHCNSCVFGLGIIISIKHSRHDATTDRPGW